MPAPSRSGIATKRLPSAAASAWRYSLASLWSSWYALTSTAEASAAPAATAASGRHARIRKGLRARRGGAIAARTRSSKPAGGSSSGATRSRSSTTFVSCSSSRRQSRQWAACASTRARSSPLAIPSASSAVISRISSQSALICRLQCPAKSCHPCPDPRLRGPDRDVLDLADLVRGAPHVGRQEDRAPLFGRKRGQGVADTCALLWVCCPRSAGVGLQPSGECVRVDRLGALESQHVDRRVAGDAEQPREDAPAADVVARGIPPGPDEDVLGQVLGRGPVLQHRQCESVDRPLEASDERGRRIGVPRGHSREKRVVGARHIHQYGFRAANGLCRLRNPFGRPTPYPGKAIVSGKESHEQAEAANSRSGSRI